MTSVFESITTKCLKRAYPVKTDTHYIKECHTRPFYGSN